MVQQIINVVCTVITIATRKHVLCIKSNIVPNIVISEHTPPLNYIGYRPKNMGIVETMDFRLVFVDARKLVSLLNNIVYKYINNITNKLKIYIKIINISLTYNKNNISQNNPTCSSVAYI